MNSPPLQKGSIISYQLSLDVSDNRCGFSQLQLSGYGLTDLSGLTTIHHMGPLY